MGFNNLRLVSTAKVCAFVLCAGILGCQSGHGGTPSAAIQGEALEPAPDTRFLPDLTEAERSRLDQAPLAELSFVPEEAEALIRVDLATLAGSDKTAQSMKTVDFVLRAQQPAVWEALHAASLTIGKDLTALYLVVGPNGKTADSYLIAATTRPKLDLSALATALRKRSPSLVEPAPAGSGRVATLFIWKNPAGAAVGATEQPAASQSAFVETAVGLADGVILVGTPDLVRHALAARGGLQKDIRHAAMVREILAADSMATAWGATVAGAPERSLLADAIHGLKRGHFSTALAAPGPDVTDVDGMFELRAEFAAAADADAFKVKLTFLLGTAATLGQSSPLGPTFARLRDAAKIKVDGAIVTATSTL